MTWLLYLRYRNGHETTHVLGSRAAAERLAHHLTRRHYISRWQITEGTAS